MQFFDCYGEEEEKDGEKRDPLSSLPGDCLNRDRLQRWPLVPMFMPGVHAKALIAWFLLMKIFLKWIHIELPLQTKFLMSPSFSGRSQGTDPNYPTPFHPPHRWENMQIKIISKPFFQCSYAACYCEENVFKICQNLKDNFENELDKCYAVFVSNKKRVVPLWRQKAGRDEEKLVIWDYHVIFIYRPDDRTLVYDLDSELPFPTYFHKYVTETFRTDAILNPEYHRIFRVVPATTFLQNFASDRRHMRKDDGSWLKPPPNYPCISNSASAHNLDEFISMDGSTGFGEVLSLTDFVKKFHLHWEILPFYHSKKTSLGI